MKLVIGNKNYSSWSMRPWFALRAAGIAFEEVVISLYVPGSKDEILKFSPAGKVPVLIDGDVAVWDSLAIIEYAAEKFPEAGLWPKDRAARAHARSVSAEMHSGFGPLRQHCGMNMHRPVKARDLPDDVRANVERIDEIWSHCRARYGQSGPFLFGAISAADAMYAPVVSRFETYDVKVSASARAYMDAVRAHPAWTAWKKAALAETWIIEKFEDETVK